jgi:hypothetical protein
MTEIQQRPNVYPLRLTESVKKAALEYAKQERTSLNHFIEIAVAEKIAALETISFFEKRRNKADMDAFWKFMNRSESAPPQEADVLPDNCAFVDRLQELRANPPKRGRKAL